MTPGEDDTEKPHEPTQKRLEDARRKGQVVRSADVTAAAAHAGFLLAFLFAGGAGVAILGGAMQSLLAAAGPLASQPLGGAFGPILRATLIETVRAIAPLFAIPALAALAAILAQRAFTVTASNLQPKLSRISLVSNARQKFGATGLFEFAKSATKMVIYSLVLGQFLMNRVDLLIALPHTDPGPALLVMVELLLQLMALVLVIAVPIAAIDYLWQYATHMQQQRMSLKDLKDEMKESEGDPAIRQQRRARAQTAAQRQLAAEVPKADVVIVNPTHYAVALKWSRQQGAAPVCVAKGVDEVALRIRSLAEAARVPIHSDPPTARALHATVAVGQEIAPEHYQAVAVAIRFAEDMRRRARAWT